MTAAPDRKFFFLHLQKTAGTSLLFQFRETFPAEQIYPNKDDGDAMRVGPQFDLDRLNEGWQARGPQLRLIIGHFPLCAIQQFGEPFTTMTMVREPVERTLSFLRHHRKLHPADNHLTLPEIYADDFRFRALIHNHMTKMLGMTADEMTNGMLTPLETTPAHLARAKQNLADMDVVGLQHQFQLFCDEVNQRFGWGIVEGPRVNTSAPEPVSPAFEEQIRADNAHDVELFEYACDLVAQRTAARTPAPKQASGRLRRLLPQRR